jgi:hypothetical protein
MAVVDLERTVNILEAQTRRNRTCGSSGSCSATWASRATRWSGDGQPKTPEEFLQTMRDEGRLIYEFEVGGRTAYGACRRDPSSEE